MGLFSKMFGQAQELTKLGNTVINIKNFLDGYEQENDISFLLCAAWMCKVGILDRIVKNNWQSNYCVYVPINGHQTKMFMNEVQLYTIGRLSKKVSQIGNLELQKMIDEILEGGNAFDMIDKKIPQDLRNAINTI